MLKVVGTSHGPETPAWMVQLEARLVGPGGAAAAGTDQLRSMAELMQRTHGVRAVALVPRPASIVVAVCLRAPDATSAMEWGRALVTASARRVGLGEMAVSGMRVDLEPPVSRGGAAPRDRDRDRAARLE
jgi:hypothetical protein